MKLQTKKVIYVGLAFMIICMFWQVYDNVISKMLINTFGLNQTWSGIVMALDNLFALFMLPLFGALSDKTKTKYGKRRDCAEYGCFSCCAVCTDVQNIRICHCKTNKRSKLKTCFLLRRIRRRWKFRKRKKR